MEIVVVLDLFLFSYNGIVGKIRYDIFDISNNFNEVSVYVDNFENINNMNLRLLFFEIFINFWLYKFFYEFCESNC